MERITRRSFISTTIGALVSLELGFLACSRKKKELFIYNWPYYISENTIPGFEKEFGVKNHL